jgi:hypothetical protein
MCLTALIQRARGEVSSYHLSLAHHITLTMLPAILGVAAQLLLLKQRNDDNRNRIRRPEEPTAHEYNTPWNTIFLCSVCFSLIFGVMGSILSLGDSRCSFDGNHLMGPSDLPLIVWLGLGIYFLGWLTLMFLSLRKFRNKTRRIREIVEPVCQLAVLAGTAGLIYYVEYNVRFAQGFLQGGSEDSWGFGQILAMISLIVPIMEMVKYGVSELRGDWRKSRFKVWIETGGRRLKGVLQRVKLEVESG